MVSWFLGSYLAEELLRRGANVYGLVRKRADGSKPKNLVDIGIVHKVELIEGLNGYNIISECIGYFRAGCDISFRCAVSFVPRSLTHPIETFEINTIGTANLLEAVRIKDYDPVIVFAGTSGEYGLVISSEEQYERAKQKYGVIFPEPERIPELPIKETNPLRPMSPYAVSKVYGDYLMRNYHYSYGLKTIVSRAFNHEGAGRGLEFVTSVITSQVMKLKFGECNKIIIGNVNAFRDWSHIKDIVNGYILLAEKGRYGDVYNQGSMRTNSVLSYILLSLEEAGWEVRKIETLNGEKVVENPTEIDNSEMFGVKFEKTKIDRTILDGKIEYAIEDKGLILHTDSGKVLVEFDPKRFRPAEVPILLSDTTKIQNMGFKAKYRLIEIIRDQLNYFLKKENRT